MTPERMAEIRAELALWGPRGFAQAPLIEELILAIETEQVATRERETAAAGSRLLQRAQHGQPDQIALLARITAAAERIADRMPLGPDRRGM